MSSERRGPAICNVSNIGEGKDEMTKASIDLQDLRRRIYVKAKAEPSWRFWGLANHIGPKPCAGRKLIRGADAVCVAEGNMPNRANASAWATRRGRRTWHV